MILPDLPKSSAFCLTEKQRQQIADIIKPRTTRFIPITLTPKQALFLSHPYEEGLFGGAAGGGKSDGGLAGALQYVDQPNYNALIIRRNTTLLDRGGALIPRSKQWLTGTGATFDKSKRTWTFPSGATITFGYLDSEDDAMNYKGTDWQYIFIDELTEIPWESAYDYLHSRMRRPKGSNIPLRLRCTTNPGGPGHEWVKRKFITEKRPNHFFIPAFLQDNPYIDQVDYRRRLNTLHPIIRDMLLYGIWDIAIEGNIFKSAWWKVEPLITIPRELRQVRYWDLAASEGRGDYIAGLKLGESNNRYWVLDLVRGQLSPEGVEELLSVTARKDGIGVRQVIELEPGASSKILANHFRKDVLKGFAYIEDRPTGSKLARAYPVATAVASGAVQLVEAAWNSTLIVEASLFPSKRKDVHDDIVDTLSGAYNYLANAGGRNQPSTAQAAGGSQYDTQRHDALPIYRGSAYYG